MKNGRNFWKVWYLIEEKLNTKSSKNIYVRNVVLTATIKRCRGQKKRGVRAIDGLRKTLMIPDSKVPECPKTEFKSKIGELFMTEKILEEYSVKIYEIDGFFMSTA